MSKRFWELDFSRGCAVLLMIIFNYAFALRFFGISEIVSGEFFWFWFPRFVGAMFISIAGISLAISYARTGKKGIHGKYLRRGLSIFLLGMLITLATWAFVPHQAVLFGILHLIGASVIMAPLFLRLGKWNVLLGLALTAAGIYLSGFSLDTPWLLWLGLQPHGFATLDYFPLLPWFGIFLLGMAAGSALYKHGKRNFRIKETKNLLASSMVFLGRNSLAIYLLHIPFLLVLLGALGFPLL
ncbi:MAG: DUF1624 domain-containing protein [Candidatus Aenigmarchaeota archaeon]|nr:DUF1624 domain-containing protein [Candidatus Aenigmarchaeota archaeon]